MYPHDTLRVNTVFEVVKSKGLQTAYTDKHPAYVHVYSLVQKRMLIRRALAMILSEVPVVTVLLLVTFRRLRVSQILSMPLSITISST